MNKTILSLILAIFLISFVSATTTTLTTSQSQLTVNSGDSGTISVSFSIDNTEGNAGQKGVIITGSPRFLFYSGSSISFNANTTTSGSITINYNIPSNASDGQVINSIIIDETTLDITFTVETPLICSVDIFPTTLTNVKIQQGYIKTRSIQLIVPSCFLSFADVIGVQLQTDEKPIQLGELAIGKIQPGNSLIIPLEINAEEVSTGQYQDVLDFFIYDNGGKKINVPSVNIGVSVTSSISPVTGDIFSTKPACSLSGTTFNLNTTATFSCSGVVQNLEVNPQYNEYLEGTSVDLSSGIYTYTFKPTKYGVTKFIAIFTYKGSPIFSAYESEIKINPSGTNIAGGTELKVEFYQSGDKKTIDNLREGETKILILDNVSNSMVNMEEVDLYLNGDEVNSTFNINLDEEYELRVSALNLGYIDLILKFNVTEIPIEITLSPFKTEYNVNDIINITTNPENASLLLDNVIITSPYTVISSGTFLLEAKKENYLTGQINITVKSTVSYTTINIEIADWKKGKTILMYLTENVSWSVEYEEPYEIDGETHYKEPVKIAFGETQEVEFDIEEFGRYNLKGDGSIIISRLIERKGIWNWIKNNWGWVVGGLIVLLGIYLIFFKGKKEEGMGFYGQAPKGE